MSFIKFDSQSQNPEVPEVNDVSVTEVAARLSEMKLIDVRRADEYCGELGHIRGAELISLDTLEQRMAEVPKDQSIVFICRSGIRSITACLIAKQNGTDQVYNLAGGMIEWNAQGLDVEK